MRCVTSIRWSGCRDWSHWIPSRVGCNLFARSMEAHTQFPSALCDYDGIKIEICLKTLLKEWPHSNSHQLDTLQVTTSNINTPILFQCWVITYTKISRRRQKEEEDELFVLLYNFSGSKQWTKQLGKSVEDEFPQEYWEQLLIIFLSLINNLEIHLR